MISEDYKIRPKNSIVLFKSKAELENQFKTAWSLVQPEILAELSYGRDLETIKTKYPWEDLQFDIDSDSLYSSDWVTFKYSDDDYDDRGELINSEYEVYPYSIEVSASLASHNGKCGVFFVVGDRRTNQRSTYLVPIDE